MYSLLTKKPGRKAAKHRLEQYLDRLYGYACSLMGDTEIARDMVQTCALKVLSAKKVPVDEAAYRAWLFKIIRNSCNDEFRSSKNKVVSLSLSDDDFDELWNKTGEADVSSGEQVIIDELTVHAALQRLAQNHREILVLVDMAGFTYKEAAEMLEVPIGTIMSRISRARNMMLEDLNRDQVSESRLKVVRLGQ